MCISEAMIVCTKHVCAPSQKLPLDPGTIYVGACGGHGVFFSETNRVKYCNQSPRSATVGRKGLIYFFLTCRFLLFTRAWAIKSDCYARTRVFLFLCLWLKLPILLYIDGRLSFVVFSWVAYIYQQGAFKRLTIVVHTLLLIAQASNYAHLFAPCAYEGDWRWIYTTKRTFFFFFRLLYHMIVLDMPHKCSSRDMTLWSDPLHAQTRRKQLRQHDEKKPVKRSKRREYKYDKEGGGGGSSAHARASIEGLQQVVLLLESPSTTAVCLVRFYCKSISRAMIRF